MSEFKRALAVASVSTAAALGLYATEAAVNNAWQDNRRACEEMIQPGTEKQCLDELGNDTSWTLGLLAIMPMLGGLIAGGRAYSLIDKDKE